MYFPLIHSATFAGVLESLVSSPKQTPNCVGFVRSHKTISENGWGVPKSQPNVRVFEEESQMFSFLGHTIKVAYSVVIVVGVLLAVVVAGWELLRFMEVVEVNSFEIPKKFFEAAEVIIKAGTKYLEE